MASSAITTDSTSNSNSFAISDTVGSLEFVLINLSLTCSALYAISFNDLLTLIGLLSLRYLLISPIIIGTA